MKKDFSVSEVIYGVTGYRELTGDNLDYFKEGAVLTDFETVGVDTSYYISYKGDNILFNVNELVVTEFFESGEYKKYLDK